MNSSDRHIAKSYEAIFRVNGVKVVYERGTGPSIDSTGEITAARARSNAQRMDASGITTDVFIEDWLIYADVLVLAGSRIEPQKGDRIKQVDDQGRTWVYEVMSRSSGDPCYRWSDPARTVRRIHTKLVEEIDPPTPPSPPTP